MSGSILPSLRPSRRRLAGVAAGTCAAALLGAPPEAEACGGFFCDPQQPVLQAAERIVFVERGDGRQTTIVQVTYTGPADRFSWVVPVPGVPDVGVASNVLFQRLEAATRPRFSLEVEDRCRPEPPALGWVDAGVGVDAGAAPTAGGGVSVLASGSVGPFDFEVIRPDPGLEDPAEVAVSWLGDNGYEVGDIGPDLLRPYLAMDQNLVAFRLQKSATAGDIRPIVLTYAAERALIPIRLTAVAALNDMGVITWVFGPHRAVPLNYLSLEPNLARVDWFRGGANWPEVVSEAADAAGGQGFVTEYAGPAGVLPPILEGALEAEWQRLRAQDSVNALFNGWDGLMGAFEAHVPVPDGATLRDFLNCPWCFDVPVPALPGLDAQPFLQTVETEVVAPVRIAESIIAEQPRLTRLYTTLSPEEMTVDPSFDFNPDLGDVDHVHRATARRNHCDLPFRVTLEDGRQFDAPSLSEWPVQSGPANARVLRAGLEGASEVVRDNTSDPEFGSRVGAGSGCSTPGPAGGSLVPVLLASLAALGARRAEARSAQRRSTGTSSR